MRACPYMVAWGVTTPVHPGDDGAGGPAGEVGGWAGRWSFGLLR